VIKRMIGMKLLLFWSIIYAFMQAVPAYGAKSTDVDDGSGASQIPSSPLQNLKSKQVPEVDTKPVELTARNFGRHVNSSYVWLIEFYSPHCIHCTEFAATYDEIAKVYHSSDQHNIKVGKVSGNLERALTSRFAIYAYPSFFVIDGYHVYSFEESRSKKNLMKFAEGGYKQQEALPFYSSPMGPMGLLQGAMITAGIALVDIFAWSQNTFGLSPLMTGGILFGSAFLGCFFLIVFLAIVVTPKVKHE